MTLRSVTTFGNGQTALVSSCPLPLNGTGTPAAGDVGTIYLEAVSTGGANTVVAPTSGGVAWTQETGPNLVGTTSSITYRWRKTLAAGDITAGSVTVSLPGPMRALAALVVDSGVTTTGAITPAAVVNPSATTTPTLPTAPGVPAGATVYAAMGRRSAAAPPATIALPTGSGWTTLVNISTNYGNPAEATLVVGRQVASTSGSYGGNAGSSTGQSTTGANLISALPSTNAAPNFGADQTGKEPGEPVTLTATDSDGTIASITQISGTPTVTLSGTGGTRTFTAPATLAGTTLTFRATDNGGATDDVSVTVLAATERAVIGGVEVPMYVRAT